MKIGNRTFINDNIEVAEIYHKMAHNDESAARILAQQNFYNQAAYFFVQAMEKYVKHHIAQKINVTKKFFADELGRTMGHSLNKSLQLLIKLYAGNDEILFEQMYRQIKRHVLKDVDFRFMNNSLRYPIYNERHENYVSFTLNQADCYELNKILQALKNYLGDLNRVK